MVNVIVKLYLLGGDAKIGGPGSLSSILESLTEIVMVMVMVMVMKHYHCCDG